MFRKPIDSKFTMECKGPIVYCPVVQKGKNAVTNEEFMNFFEPRFASHLRDYEKNPTEALEKAKHIACTSMNIQRRYFCRELKDLHVPLTPQQQNDMFIDVGLEMSIPVVEKALNNANIQSSDINCIIFTSHQPYPFPTFTSHLMSALQFSKDCAQIPVTSLGCAGGGFALDATNTYLLAHPTHNVLVLCLELCSLGFRPHRNGMSWFLNSALFGDAVGAFVACGADSAASATFSASTTALQLVHTKQRLVRQTTGVSFFNYDQWGYDFVTTQKLCDACRENVPDFVADLSQEAFGKLPKELPLAVIHPGGTRMIQEVGKELQLEGSRSSELAVNCMADGGNIASVSVIDMIAKSWPTLRWGDEMVCVGMGPGFVMCGAAMRTIMFISA